MITRLQIVEEARTWIGTPWKHQARQKGVGTDCIGLVGGVALAVGLPGADAWALDQTLHCYGRTPLATMLLPACDRFLRKLTASEVRLADILLMDFGHGPQHFGIVSREDPQYMVHAYAQRRKVVESQVSIPKCKVVGAYSFRGVR